MKQYISPEVELLEFHTEAVLDEETGVSETTVDTSKNEVKAIFRNITNWYNS